MNKNIFRVVFNKVRGMWMVAAETVTAAGRGRTASSQTVARDGHKRYMARLDPLAFAALVVAGAPLALMSMAHAQVIADPSAPVNQRPTILSAPNGVPQVNIQTPSAAGVSRNVYSQFDVSQQGLILNNARTNAQTQLGGWIQGNPWLATGTARVILNEVNSSSPSMLHGYVEVAGSQAQVVVANPAGVTCDGCGFINASRATLTTGVPQLNGGSLDSYRVERGTIRIDGLGMDASQTDYTDIIARAVEVNAGLWANNLRVSAGANVVDADLQTHTPISGQGARPAFAVDVSSLGGMYAGKITLVGTEAGVGVRNAGQMAASAGEITVTADGRLENIGRIAATGAVQVDARTGIANDGIVYGQGPSALATQGNIDNRGVIAGADNVTLNAAGAESRVTNSAGAVFAAGVAADGQLAGDGRLLLQATQSVTANGQNLAAGDLSIRSGSIDLSTSQTSGRNLSLTADGASLDLTRANVIADQTFAASAASSLVNDRGQISADRIVIQAHDLSNVQGEMLHLGGGDFTLQLPGAIDNRAGVIAGAGNVVIDVNRLNNTQGTLGSVQGGVEVNANTLNNTGGQIQAQGDIGLTLAGALNNTGGLVRAGGTLGVTANAIGNTGTLGPGQGLEGQSVNLTAGQISNATGAIRGDQAVTLTSGGAIDNTGGLVSAGQTATLQDANLATRSLAVDNSGGTLIAGQQLTVNSATLSGNGDFLSHGDLAINLSQDYTHTGYLQANGSASIETPGALVNQSTLLAGNVLHVQSATLDNQAGASLSGTQIHLAVSGSNTLINRGLIDGQDTVIETVTLNNLGTGRIYGDNLAIGATTVNNLGENGAAPVIGARNRLDIGADVINNRDNALIFSAGDLAIGGSLDANKQATGQASLLNNASATIEALGSVDISAAQINNTNETFSTGVQVLSADPVVEYQGSGSPNRYLAGDPAIGWTTQDQATYLVTPEGTFINWIRYNYTRTTTETTVLSSDPAQILSGGAMRITADNVLNDNSRILAGGSLFGTIGALVNTEVAGEHVVADNGTVTYASRGTYCANKKLGICLDWDYNTNYSTSGYNPAPVVQSVVLTPTVFKENAAPAGTGTPLSARRSSAVNTAPSAPSGQTITQVTALNGSGAVVRSGGLNYNVPNNSLFTVVPNADSNYLVETDPRFANYRTWLRSDYLLSQLGNDPALMQKRLGDGFYEQRLVREQVAQLTCRRFLDNYASDEAQYQALMNNAVTYARAHNLRPGVALTAEQMAALTSDIVWLVEKDVTLADGSVQKVLVPQLYVRVRDGDLLGSGALLAGRDVRLNLTGDLTNLGTIAGRDVVLLTADNVKNLGGRILASDVGVSARTDLDNLGGTLAAVNNLTATAGRDLNGVSTTRTQTNAQGSRTSINRVAGLYVTGSGGTLLATAGRDMNLVAAALDSGGATLLAAGRDLTLGTVSEAQSQRIVWNGDNWREEAQAREAGTLVKSAGELRLSAGNDLNARAARVTSQQGALLATAAGNVGLSAGEARRSLDEVHQATYGSGLFSRTTTATRDTLAETTAVGTTFSGDTVLVQAGQDLTVRGSQVVSTTGTGLAAGNNLTLESATQTSTSSRLRDEKKSGLFGSGGIGLTLGTRQQTVHAQETGTTASASTVGATSGNVTLAAGQRYTQVGSDVLAPQGDIDIRAQRVDITEARNTARREQETKFKQSGLTLALTSPVISAIQTASQMKDAAGQTSDPRMQALAAANIALAGRNAVNAIEAGQGTQINGKEGQIATGKDAAGNPTSRDANAADQAGGVNLSISLGGSQSTSKTTQTSSTARGATVTAGNNVNISATGAGKDSDLTLQGSTVTAGNNINLKAGNKVNLLAAPSSAEQHASNQSKSGAIGIGFALGGSQNGFTIQAGASAARGHAAGHDVAWSNTRVQAGDTVTLQSGGDTTLKGAVVSAKRVTASVGEDLTIESLQDKSRYEASQRSIGASVSLCLPPFCYGASSTGSLSLGRSLIDSDYASVTEQSGIKAGDGGFQVNVKGDTDLKGGAITSTQTAIDQNKNRFETGTLSSSDIQNKAEYKGNKVGLGIGTSIDLQGKLSPSGTSVGFGKDSGNASSTTQAALSGIAGNKNARTGDKETGISKIFDAEKVQKEIDAQVTITQTFGREAPKAAANFAQQQANDLRAQAKAAAEAGNINRARELSAEAQRWDEGGAYRVALHTALGGLSGGVQGALGAGAAASAAPLLDQLQENIAQTLKDAGAGDTVAKLAGQIIAQGTAAGIGSVASGGSTAGAAMGFNVDANNRQLHPSEIKWLRDKAKEFAKKEGISEKQALARLTQQALKQVDYLWRAQLADGDDAVAKAFLATAKQTFTNDLGEQQKLFTATGQQLFRPEMFADTADPAFYRQFAQSGISRPLSAGLTKELKDSGIALKDGTIDLLKAARDNPQAVLNGLWNAVKGLPGAVVDGFKETGHAIGEGSAVAFNDDIGAKLNAIYGADVAGYQQALLAIRTLSALTGAAGAAKAGVGLSEEAAKAVGKKLDEELARQFKLDAGAIRGFRSADELNAMMKSAEWAPAWKPGTAVAETIIQPGTRVRMVVDEKAWDEIGQGDFKRAFGGWATFDNVPNQAYARNQLAITAGMKGNVGYVIEIEITKPINAHVGVVGPQGSATGGGNQLHFILQAADRSGAFKYVPGSGRVLP